MTWPLHVPRLGRKVSNPAWIKSISWASPSVVAGLLHLQVLFGHPMPLGCQGWGGGFRSSSEGSLSNIPVDPCQCHWSFRWGLPFSSGEELNYFSHLLLLNWGGGHLTWVPFCHWIEVLRCPTTMFSFCLSPHSSGQSSLFVALFLGPIVVLSREEQGKNWFYAICVISAAFLNQILNQQYIGERQVTKVFCLFQVIFICVCIYLLINNNHLKIGKVHIKSWSSGFSEIIKSGHVAWTWQ